MLRTDAHDTPTAVARVYRRTKARWLRKVAKGFIGGTLPTCTPMASAVTSGCCPRCAARFAAAADINSGVLGDGKLPYAPVNARMGGRIIRGNLAVGNHSLTLKGDGLPTVLNGIARHLPKAKENLDTSNNQTRTLRVTD